ncbi:MAG: [LysW]-aminoadipate kinase [Anaerolineae bacterium]|nr:[LysW]-aminoadipate kinase [Anaerolineae bacterium]
MLTDLLVVKLGGAEGVDLASGCEDLVEFLRRDRRPLVLVHGASAEADRLCKKAGRPLRTLTSPSGHSSRYTDAATRDLFVQAAEAVNREILACLRRGGVEAVGLTGADITIRARRKQVLRALVEGRVRIVRDDYSGTIATVDGQTLRAHLLAGRIPVLPPLADSPDGLLNIDGDRAAAAVAAELGADDLIILSNVRGLYRNFPDEDSIVPVVASGEREQALAWAQGRMKRKVLAATEALVGGVGRVIISDGRVRQPVQQALAGAGSVFES